ncbi:MAG: hypothetical protein WBB23_21950 [Desulforhopalus sp.]
MPIVYLKVDINERDYPRFIRDMQKYDAKLSETVAISDFQKESGISTTTLDRWIRVRGIKITQPAGEKGKRFASRADLQGIVEDIDETKPTKKIKRFM